MSSLYYVYIGIILLGIRNPYINFCAVALLVLYILAKSKLRKVFANEQVDRSGICFGELEYFRMLGIKKKLNSISYIVLLISPIIFAFIMLMFPLLVFLFLLEIVKAEAIAIQIIVFGITFISSLLVFIYLPLSFLRLSYRMVKDLYQTKSVTEQLIFTILFFLFRDLMIVILNAPIITDEYRETILNSDNKMETKAIRANQDFLYECPTCHSKLLENTNCCPFCGKNIK